jgi:hypothetical protein
MEQPRRIARCWRATAMALLERAPGEPAAHACAKPDFQSHPYKSPSRIYRSVWQQQKPGGSESVWPTTNRDVPLCLDWYISEMAKERKSPQEKKELEYTRDHFTFGWKSSRMFPKTWKLKKTHLNRQYRRKSEQLLAQTKSGIAVDDLGSVADDLTVARFQKSLTRKRLHKTDTVTVGEKVKRKLKRREEAVGRNVQRDRHYDREATSAISTLRSLDAEKFVDVVRHADVLCGTRNEDELKRVRQSNDPVDKALHFLYRIASGSAFEHDALRRNPQLDEGLAVWIEKAKRILNRDKRAAETKLEQKRVTRMKLKALRKR